MAAMPVVGSLGRREVGMEHIEDLQKVFEECFNGLQKVLERYLKRGAEMPFFLCLDGRLGGQMGGQNREKTPLESPPIRT